MTSDQVDHSDETAALFKTAFDTIYDQYHASVYRFAYYLTRCRDETDELFQETWLRTVKALKKNPDIRNVQAWLFAITSNVHRDTLRKKRVRRLFYKQKIDAFSKEGSNRSGVMRGFSGQQTGDSGTIELGLSIREAIADLPERQRRIFILKEIEGFTHREIGEILHIPTGTVKSLLHRAVKQLRLCLE